MTEVYESMTEYFHWLLTEWQTRFGTLPKVPYDEEVDPFIYEGEPDDDEWICWKPVRKTKVHDLTELERKLNITIHDSIHQYFNAYWFCSLGGIMKSSGLELHPVLPGKELEDYEMLLHGYKTAHDASCGTVPIGVERNGLIIVLDTRDGTVLLEDFEKHSFKKIAISLASLIRGLR